MSDRGDRPVAMDGSDTGVRRTPGVSSPPGTGGSGPPARRGLLHSTAPAATVLIRAMVGAVFVSEGIQKFLYPDSVGAGRFASIGIPSPEVMGPLVGVVEIGCGALVLLGLATRLAVLPLIGVMLVAIVSTKLPILLGSDLGPFRVRSLDEYGFWSMAHESRTDFAMLMGSLFLLVVGAGRWSVDAAISRARPVPTAGPAAGRRWIEDR